MWVLQEFAVAKDVYFQCGNKRSRLDAFKTSVTLLAKTLFSAAYSFASTQSWMGLMKDGTIEAISKSPTENMAQSVFRERHHYQGIISRNQRNMANLLITFNPIRATDLRLRATDPKDKVYGILGLARDVEKLAIVPDYAKSIEEVYTEVTARILATGEFQFLQLCCYDPDSRLPSWVPDLRKDIKATPMNRATSTSDSRPLHLASPHTIQKL